MIIYSSFVTIGLDISLEIEILRTLEKSNPPPFASGNSSTSLHRKKQRYPNPRFPNISGFPNKSRRFLFDQRHQGTKTVLGSYSVYWIVLQYSNNSSEGRREAYTGAGNESEANIQTSTPNEELQQTVIREGNQKENEKKQEEDLKLKHIKKGTKTFNQARDEAKTTTKGE